MAQLQFDLKHCLVQAAIGNTQDLLQVLEEFAAGAILADSFFMAVARVSEMKGMPWAQRGIARLTLPSADAVLLGLGLKPNPSLPRKLRNRVLYSLLQPIGFRDVQTRITRAHQQLRIEP